MLTNSLIDSALVFAARAHDGQRRKSTDIPYIVHPVGVMMALVECGETDPELLAAALLHDTVEDTGVTLAQVREKFGERIAKIVEGCSEPDKSDTWENRKQHTVAHLKTAPRDVQLVSAADKLHNLRSIIDDHAILGDDLWSYFRRGRAETAWYYHAIVTSLRHGGLAHHMIVRELDSLVNSFFGDAD